jgi:hypothetical protein
MNIVMQLLQSTKRALFIATLIASAVIVVAGNSRLALAQSSGGIVREDDYQSLIDETTFYDIVPLGSCGAAADADGLTLEGKDNIQKAFNYFIAQGLTPIQSAGILGNLRQESGVNPASNNSAAKASSIHPSSIIPGETFRGGGIAQWEDYQGTPTRWTGANGLLNYVAGKGSTFNGKPQGNGKNWKVLEFQLNFIWWEMNHTHRSTLPAMKSATTLEAAVSAFLKHFEKAGDPRIENRVRYAKETLDAFGGMVPDNVSPTGACGGTGIVVDGYSFPVEPQTRRSYTTIPCAPGHPGAQTRDYRDEYGKTTHITTCHHDGTPAFDLMYDGVAGKKIYAITKGKIVKVNREYVMDSSRSGKPCGSIQFQANNETGDKTYYWYGHILPSAEVTPGKEFDPAKNGVMGTVATRDFGPKCWGGGPHLHIDRGCIQGNNPKQGGSDDCRDPQFLQDLQKIWEGLPQP